MKEFYIEDMTSQLRGVAKSERLVYFIKGAVLGDTVTITNEVKKKSFIEADVLDIVSPSEFRVDGASDEAILSGLSYEKEFEWKVNGLKMNLKKMAGLDVDVEEYTAKTLTHYRDNTQVKVARGYNGEVAIGYFEEGTNRVVDSEEMLYMNKEALRVYQGIRKFVKENYKGYDWKAKKGDIKDIVFRNNEKDELMIIFVSHDEITIDIEKLKAAIDMSRVKSIYLNINDKSDKVLYGRKFIKLYGDDFLSVNILGLDFKIYPQTFLQVNLEMMDVLYKKALEYLGDSAEMDVLELYSGIGTISLCAAKEAKSVTAVEVVEASVKSADENAEANGIKNAKFIHAKAEDAINRVLKEKTYDAVIVDPPRKGLDKKVVEMLNASGIEKIVYISCNHASLARDIALMSGVYRVERVAAVDMFARSPHLETVALLSKLNIAKNRISVKIDTDEEDLTGSESKATYSQIKKYVLDNFNLKVSTLYIAQMFDKFGLKTRINYNKSKKDNAKVPICTPEKESAIIEALNYYQMI